MSKLWIVGGESGIGEQIANDSVAYFDTVVTTGKNIDVRDWDMLEEFAGANGPFTHVVYSAGVAQLEFIEGLSAYDVRDLYDINVLGFLGLMRGLSRQQESGRVVCIVSDASNTPMRGSIAYCTSKAALDMAVRVSARELAPEFVVMGLSPSIVDDTQMTLWVDATVPEFRGWTEEQARAYEKSMVPMGRRATKQEVSAQVLSMLVHSPEFMTGSVVKMTGGK